MPMNEMNLYSIHVIYTIIFFFFFQAEDGIRDKLVTGVQTCALPIFAGDGAALLRRAHADAGLGARSALRRLRARKGHALDALHERQGARGRRRSRRRRSSRAGPDDYAHPASLSALPAYNCR